MKTILLLVVSFPLLGQMFPFPGPGLPPSTPSATVSLVQAVSASFNVGNPPTTTCTISSTTAGDFIFVQAVEGNTSSTLTITDNQGGTSAGGSPQYVLNMSDTSTGILANTYRYWNVASGITTITIAGSVFSGAGGTCRVYHKTDGAFVVDPLDINALFNYSGFTGSNSFTSNPQSATTTTSNDFLVGVSFEGVGGGTSESYVTGTGWSNGQSVVNTGGATCFSEDWLNIPINTYDATGSLTATGQASFKWATQVIAFKVL